jgi:uncharacterized protein YerC
MSEDQVLDIIRLFKKGKMVKEIHEITGISQTTITKHLRLNGHDSSAHKNKRKIRKEYDVNIK